MPVTLAGQDPVGEVKNVNTPYANYKTDSAGNVVGEDGKIAWTPSNIDSPVSNGPSKNIIKKPATEPTSDQIAAGLGGYPRTSETTLTRNPTTKPVIAVDYNSGDTYDVTNPARPVRVGMTRTEAGVYNVVSLREADKARAATQKAIRQENQAVQKQLKQFEADKIRLPDNNYIEISKWNQIPQKYQHIALTEGYDSMSKSMENDYQVEKAAYDAEVAKINKALKAVEPYKTSDGGVDLDTAILKGVSDDDLKVLFDDKTIKDSHDRIDPVITKYKELAAIASKYGLTKDSEGKLDLTKLDFHSASPSSIKDYLKAQKLVSDINIAKRTFAESGADIKKLDERIQAKLNSLPKGAAIPAKFVAGVVTGGVILAPIGVASFGASVIDIPFQKNKGDYIKGVATGIKDYFVKEIPASIVADPAYASGQVTGMFILGPSGVLKLAKGIAAKTSPWYIPNQGMRFTFSTGKLPTKYGEISQALKSGKITEVQIANAIAKAERKAIKNPEGVAVSRIGSSNLKVSIKPTPVSKNLGGALWHATSEKTPFAGKEFKVDIAKTEKEPALFASLHAAPRFALQTASGSPATAPALVMIYTKAGIKYFPFKSATLAEMRLKGFKYLGSGKAKPGAYPPIKYYKGRFENEVMFPNGMKIARVKNLRSRLLGEKAGEFITTADGWVMPIYRYAEKGAKVPKADLARLAAIRVETIGHALTNLGKRARQGFKAEKFESLEQLTKEFKEVSLKASKGKKGAAAEKAVEKSIDRVSRERIRRIYDRNRGLFERAFRDNPRRFEDSYNNRLDYNLRRDYPVRESLRVARPSITERATAPRSDTVRPDNIRPPEPIRPPVSPRPDIIRPPETPRVEPPRVEPPRPPERPEPPREPIPTENTTSIQSSKKIDNGNNIHTSEDRANAVTWKQGIGYWIVFPDKSVDWSRTKPEGIKEVPGPDKNKPAATIQVYQPTRRGKIQDFDADMGIQDVRVRKQGKRIISIGFKQDRGQRTNNPVRLGFKSTRQGKIYHTKIGKGEIISRRPL
jgi:hypothetical protein